MEPLGEDVLVRFTHSTQIGGKSLNIFQNGEAKVNKHNDVAKQSKLIDQEKLSKIKNGIVSLLTVQDRKFTIWVMMLDEST
jgi:hypothetical protein